MTRLILFLVLLLAAHPASAQSFPALTGRVVDAANIIPADVEAELVRKSEALEQSRSRQLVIATVPSLEGHPIDDYGYQLGRKWGIGQKGSNNGMILLVAPNERQVRIEVGYGLEPIMTDGLAGEIIDGQIVPAFKKGDYGAGIAAGADSIIAQLQAPPEQAEQKALAAQQARQSRRSSGGGGSIFPLIFWGIVFLFVILPMLRRGRRGRRHRRSGVWVWGPGLGGGWGGGGWGGGSSGGGFGGFGGGGGGGFSGGGGSFGGGGASGGW